MSKLTEREMELFRRIVILSKRLDDCNPSVGIGPFLETIAMEEASALSFEIDDDDIDEACAWVRL